MPLDGVNPASTPRWQKASDLFTANRRHACFSSFGKNAAMIPISGK